jgi:uncharacterized protein (DUF934 family)
MALFKRGVQLPNEWAYVADDVAAPEAGAITVSLARWQREREALIARKDPVGVRLANRLSVLELARDVDILPLIEVEFPKFTDGRAFSQARQLREELGYRGELRAVGAVLRDQYLFMIRCGIDAVELPDGATVDGYSAALGEFSVWYQPASDERVPAFILRQQAANRSSLGSGHSLTANVAASPSII